MAFMLQIIHPPVMAGPGVAFGLPIDEAVQAVHELARSLDAAAKRTPKSQGFGRKIAHAVQAKVAARNHSRTTGATAENETFGKLIAAAVKHRTASRSGTQRQR